MFKAPTQVTVPVVDLETGKAAQVASLAFVTPEFSLPLIAEAVHVLRQRMRIRRAHAKDRSEVRGGGRKPWAQKHTGRARHASTRSPIWVGGGVVFGPRVRREARSRMPHQQRQLSLAYALSAQAASGAVQVVRLPQSLPTKTKAVAALFGNTVRVLLILADEHEPLLTVVRNLPTVAALRVQDVNTADVAAAKMIWIDEAALPVLTNRL